MGKWLTPDTPSDGYIWRVLRIPNSEEFLAILNGALIDLTYPASFEEFGDLAPAAVAILFQALYDWYVSSTMEGSLGGSIGTIFSHACATPPTNSLACDGSSYLRVDYPDLYAVLATTYHTDSDHFVVPDLRGRVVVGAGQGTGLTDRTLNSSGGEESHQLSVGELPAHHHFYSQWDTASGAASTKGTVKAAGGVATLNSSDTGSGTPHNNMQPFLALSYAIWAL